jgi:hypothetical protein
MSTDPLNRNRFQPDVARGKAQLANQKLVCGTLKKCGLQGHGLITNEHLELYYDIHASDHRDVGYISKGWEDPGFRVGNVIQMPVNWVEAKKKHLPTLMKHCATRGVAMTGEKLNGDTFEFHLDSVIYSDGFNQKVLAQIVECLSECVKKIRATFAAK